MSTPSLAAQRRRFAVAVPAAGALGVLFAVLLQPALFSESPRQSVSGAGLLLGGVFAAISCQLRAAQTTGRRRRSWQLLAIAAVIAVAGNVWVAIIGADPVDSPSAIGDASIAVALILSIVALLNFPSVRRRGIDLLVMSLDGLVMGAAVLIIASVLVYSELLDAPSGEPRRAVHVAALPAAGRRPRDRGPAARRPQPRRRPPRAGAGRRRLHHVRHRRPRPSRSRSRRRPSSSAPRSTSAGSPATC